MIGLKKTALTALLVGIGFTDASQAGLLYNIIDLGTLGGSTSFGNGINASGQVTGFSTTTDGKEHAFVTNPSGVMRDLGTLGGKTSFGNAINSSGQVTGYSYTANGQYRAFISDANAVMSDLGTLGGDNSSGTGINDSGQVAINRGTGNWGINAYGQLVGTMYVGDNFSDARYHAVVVAINGELITDVGLSAGTNSFGVAINDFGQVTGAVGSMPNYLPNHAFVTTLSGQMTDLGTLGGGYSSGMGINSFGQVTGYSNTVNGSTHAFVTNNGTMSDLNALLVTSVTGWELYSASGINDVGQITGYGVHNGLTRAFLLTPVSAVPVPSAVWLFGSGLVGLRSLNRRKNKTAR